MVLTGMQAGDWGNWAPGNEGVYYIPKRQNRESMIQYLQLADGSIRTVSVLPKQPLFGNSGLALSPEGQTLLFGVVDQDESNIFVQ